MDKLPLCGNPKCCVSTGIHDGLTFGSGELDYNGFWEKPCHVCARGYEKMKPSAAPCWPYKDNRTVWKKVYVWCANLRLRYLSWKFEYYLAKANKITNKINKIADKNKQASF